MKVHPKDGDIPVGKGRCPCGGRQWRTRDLGIGASSGDPNGRFPMASALKSDFGALQAKL